MNNLSKYRQNILQIIETTELNELAKILFRLLSVKVNSVESVSWLKTDRREILKETLLF